MAGTRHYTEQVHGSIREGSALAQAIDLHETDADLSSWIESTLDARIEHCERTPSGGSRFTYLVDLRRAGGTSSVVVRCEGDGAFTGTELSLAREATAYRALQDTSVPSPAVLGEREDGSAVVLERLEGSADLTGLNSQQRSVALQRFVGVLAHLHRLDPLALNLPGFAYPRSPEEHARLDIAMWQRLAGHVDDIDPLLVFCGSWLSAHPPGSVARTCFVQGDTGPGNFLFDGGVVTGIVDLEFAHIGDPVDDVAWLLMRMRAEPDEATELLESYEQLSGVRVDEASLRYYRLAVDYRCAVTTSLAVTRGGGARGLAPYLLGTRRYLDGVAHRLAGALGVEVTPVGFASPATPREPLYDQLLSEVRSGARQIIEAEARERTRDSQIFVHYLRAYDRFGTDLERLDAQDRHDNLGQLTDAELVSQAARAGAEADGDLLAYLLRRHARKAILWQTLLDR